MQNEELEQFSQDSITDSTKRNAYPLLRKGVFLHKDISGISKIRFVSGQRKLLRGENVQEPDVVMSEASPIVRFYSVWRHLSELRMVSPMDQTQMFSRFLPF